MSDEMDLDLPLTTSEKGYGTDWEKLRAWCLRLHISRHGWTCEGFMCPPHPSRDLQGHHRVPLSEGGESIPSNVKIYCSTCHGRLHAYRQHPWSRCPAGGTCPHPPSGKTFCCGSPAR